MRRHKLILVTFLLVPLALRTDSPVQGPLKLLAEADRLALLYNWPEATPRDAEAESLFAQTGDAKNALAARLGYLWSIADAGVSPEINREVATYLDSPLVQSDTALRLRALVAKAVLDRNSNEIANELQCYVGINEEKAIGNSMLKSSMHVLSARLCARTCEPL